MKITFFISIIFFAMPCQVHALSEEINSNHSTNELIRLGYAKDCRLTPGCLRNQESADSLQNAIGINSREQIQNIARSWHGTLTYRFSTKDGTASTFSIFNRNVQGARRLKDDIFTWDYYNILSLNKESDVEYSFNKNEKKSRELFEILVQTNKISVSDKTLKISYKTLHKHLFTTPIPINYRTNQTYNWVDGKVTFRQLYTKVIEANCGSANFYAGMHVGNNRDLERSHACAVAGLLFPDAAGSASHIIALGYRIKNALGIYDYANEILERAGFDIRNPESPRYQNESFSLVESGYYALSRMTTSKIIPQISTSNSMTLFGIVRNLLIMRSGPFIYNPYSKTLFSQTYVKTFGDSQHLSLLDDTVAMFKLLPMQSKLNLIHTLARVWKASGGTSDSLQRNLGNSITVPDFNNLDTTQSADLDKSFVNDAGFGVMRGSNFEDGKSMSLLYRGTGFELSHWKEDQGSFELFAYGSPILLNTDAYPYDTVYRGWDINRLMKASRYKNALSFEDDAEHHLYGLQGTSAMQAHVRVAHTSNELDYTMIDTTGAYTFSTSANFFGKSYNLISKKTNISRSIFFVKKSGYFILVDKITNLPIADAKNNGRNIFTATTNFQIPGNETNDPVVSYDTTSNSLLVGSISNSCNGLQIMSPASGATLTQQLVTDKVIDAADVSKDPNWGLNFAPGWRRAHVTNRINLNQDLSGLANGIIISILYPINTNAADCTQISSNLKSSKITNSDASKLDLEITLSNNIIHRIELNNNNEAKFTNKTTNSVVSFINKYDTQSKHLSYTYSNGYITIKNISRKTITDPIWVLGAKGNGQASNNILVDPKGPNSTYGIATMITASPLRPGSKISAPVAPFSGSLLAVAVGRNF